MKLNEESHREKKETVLEYWIMKQNMAAWVVDNRM